MAAGRESLAASRIAEAVLDLVGDIPDPTYEPSASPRDAARRIARASASRAAFAAGALALPSGPVGWLTILPEMLSVWRIQGAMVADIAASYGKHASLTREHMLYCLFKQTASQAVRDIVVRLGERVILRRGTAPVMQTMARRIGANLLQGVVARSASRWLPAVGALGVAGYAYYDTAGVARLAIELFERELEIEEPPDDEP